MPQFLQRRHSGSRVYPIGRRTPAIGPAMSTARWLGHVWLGALRLGQVSLSMCAERPPDIGFVGHRIGFPETANPSPALAHRMEHLRRPVRFAAFRGPLTQYAVAWNVRVWSRHAALPIKCPPWPRAFKTLSLGMQ